MVIQPKNDFVKAAALLRQDNILLQPEQPFEKIIINKTRYGTSKSIQCDT